MPLIVAPSTTLWWIAAGDRLGGTPSCKNALRWHKLRFKILTTALPYRQAAGETPALQIQPLPISSFILSAAKSAISSTEALAKVEALATADLPLLPILQSCTSRFRHFPASLRP